MQYIVDYSVILKKCAEFSTLQLFFDLYFSLPSTLSPHALACLVQIASVRYNQSFDNQKIGIGYSLFVRTVVWLYMKVLL